MRRAPGRWRWWLGGVVLAGILVGGLLWWRVGPREEGGRQRLRLVDLPPPPGPEAVARALSLDPALALSAATTDVVLAIVCTARSDRLEVYGNARPTTPFLAQMAARGVVFDRTVVQAPWTRPSVGSLLTGRWPRALLLDDPRPDQLQDRALSEAHLTLAERFQEAGYVTIGASANPNITSTFGFDQGFHFYQEPAALWRERQHSASGDTLVDQVLLDLDEVAPDRRVYLQAMFVDTHAPRRPSRDAWRALRGTSDPDDPRPLPQRVQVYDAALRTLDGHLARLLHEVRTRRPNVLFVVIGDHGEGLLLPRRHGPGHGNHLYRTTTDVPFLVFHPALPDPGRRVGGLAAGLDLVPTLADLLGLPPPSPVDGQSQAAAILGQAPQASHQRLFAETYFRSASKAGVYEADLHLLANRRGTAPPALYAVEAPLDVEDLRDGRPEDARRMEAALDRWQAEMDALEAAAGEPTLARMDRSTHEQLEALGYLDPEAE